MKENFIKLHNNLLIVFMSEKWIEKSEDGEKTMYYKIFERPNKNYLLEI